MIRKIKNELSDLTVSREERFGEEVPAISVAVFDAKLVALYRVKRKLSCRIDRYSDNGPFRNKPVRKAK